MTSRAELVACKYCRKIATHYILKKARYGKGAKKTSNYVCNDIICNIQYPMDDIVKLRSLHTYNQYYQNLVLSYMLRYTSYNDNLLPSIALYIYENDVFYDDARFALDLVKSYKGYLCNIYIIIAWIQDVILKYQNRINAEISSTDLYSIRDIIIGYL